MDDKDDQIAKLKKLVSEAYREGFGAGERYAIASHEDFVQIYPDVGEAWMKSASKGILDTHTPAV